MAPINTRSHIVLDKESMKKYIVSSGALYSGIFEMNLREESYNTLFSTDEVHFIAQGGSTEDFQKTVRDHVHPEDLKAFFAAFEIETLKKIVKENLHQSVEFRCFAPGKEYQWVRILITPDEVEKDTVLCFITDIQAQKQCEILEEQNAMLTALLSKLYNCSAAESDRFRDHVRGLAEYKNLTAEAAR